MANGHDPTPPLGGTKPRTILGRRDVAIVPWAAICVTSVAVLLSQWLRSGSHPIDWIVMGIAGYGCVSSAVMVRVQDTVIGLRLRETVWVYLSGSGLLLASLAFFAVRDVGVETPFYLGTVPLAAYVGLVIPRTASRLFLLVMVGTTVGVQVLNGSSAVFDCVVVACLIVSGWTVGMLSGLAHARASRVAAAASSYDPLTTMLNRRGITQQLNVHQHARGVPSGPVALLMVDLDGFKAINDEHGHAAGDELLAWVGTQIPRALPANAELGRLGGDEFAALLPATTPFEAVRIAHAVRDVLAPRIGASVGVATSVTRDVEPDELLRVGDTALYVCKRSPTVHVHRLEAMPASVRAREGLTTAAPSAPAGQQQAAVPSTHLSYAAMRASGNAPEPTEPGLVYGWMMSPALLVIAFMGLVVVSGAILGSGSGNLFDTLLRYTGFVWVAQFVGFAWLSRGRGHLEGRRFNVVVHGSGAALGYGVACAMLADHGIASPVMAAYFLRVLFEAALMPQRQASVGLRFMLLWWVIVAAVGPTENLWLVPYQLSIFGASFALGSIGHRAFADITSDTLDLAHTDALTGVRNRVGFDLEAEVALAAAGGNGAAFALLALDLDDFKSVNDTQGHAAGDALLRLVATTLGAECPDSSTIGRLGGDEFAIVLPVAEPGIAQGRAEQLAAALGPLIGASIGHAVFPFDGTDLDALLSAADQRSYDLKRTKERRRPTQMTA